MKCDAIFSCRIIAALLAILLAVPAAFCAGFPVDAKTDYFIEQARSVELPVTIRAAAYDSVLAAVPRRERGGWMVEKMSLYHNSCDFGEVRKLAGVALPLLDKDSVSLLCRLMYYRAFAEFHQSSYKDCFDSAIGIISMEKPDSLSYRNIDAYIMLSSIFMRLKKEEPAFDYLRRADSEYRHSAELKLPHSLLDREIGKIHLARSSAYLVSGKAEEAFEELKKARALVKSNDLRIGVLSNTGVVFGLNGDYEIACRYYNEALELEGENPNKPIVALNLVSTLIKLGRTDEARSAIVSYSRLLNQLRGGVHEGEYLRTLSELEEKSGNTTKAMDLLRSAYAKNDSILSAKNTASLADLALELENRQKEIDRTHLAGVSRSKTVVILVLAALTAVAVAVMVVLLRRHKRERREADRMHKDMEQLSQAHRREKEEAVRTVHDRETELTALTLRLAKINEALDYSIREASNQREAKDVRLANIYKSLSNLMSQDNSWEMFKLQFEQVNRDFFRRLYRRHPDLTNAEVRMCAYMLAALSSKEIASLTNRSVRTVDSIKYTMRKKMGITEPTETYLHRIAAEDDAPVPPPPD